MPSSIHKRLLSSALSLALLAALWHPLPLGAQTTNHNFEVAKSLDIFNTLYRELDLYYVDTLDARKNVENAIAYMLGLLDPYTEYYADDTTEDLRQLTTGKYAGIGSVTNYRKDLSRCIISQPFEGMPAAQAGLLPGDVIIAIDGKDVGTYSGNDSEAISAYASKVSSKLRGEPGTTFELKIYRPGTRRNYQFKITRRNVVRPSVGLAVLAADSIGYIGLSQFIEGTSNEVRRAMMDLKQQGARSLILDLRSNPGGVLEEAVKTVNLFLPRGREVVSIRGKAREQNFTYKTVLDPQDTDIPLVVLTDEGSASAAEITAGVLQDYDRALIVGRRTYGKGLVQQSRPLSYKAMLKLTTGKYYIPSGRCVQAYTFKDGEPVHLADSLSKEFRTANGRVVRDGGGITPDITLEGDSVPNLIVALGASEQLFDYCVEYRNGHPTIAEPADFRLTDEEYEDFCAYLKRHQFTYDRQSLRLLDVLRQVAEAEGYADVAKHELDSLDVKLRHNEDYEYRRWEKEVRRLVEASIVQNYYYERGLLEYELQWDSDVRRAVELLEDVKSVRKILSGEPDA